LAAARGLLIDKPGIACILGTGSNSCLYDGERIIKNVRSAGYILGDEGSGAAMGRRFLSDYLKNLTPKDLCDAFHEKFKVTPDEIMDSAFFRFFYIQSEILSYQIENIGVGIGQITHEINRI